uniref:Uncharacterized protein n=1 Tax=Opuntia streptacantha TaxID=393608 RepID=A0A7C8Z948_OPUST
MKKWHIAISSILEFYSPNLQPPPLFLTFHFQGVEYSLLLKRNPFHFQFQLSGLNILELEIHCLLDPSIDNADYAIFYEGIIIRFQPFTYLHITEHSWVSIRHCRGDEWLNINLGLTHDVIS